MPDRTVRTGTAVSRTMAPKSAGQSAGRGRPFEKGKDPRRGRRPMRGAPNAGRTPDELRGMAAAGLPAFIARCVAIIERGENDDTVIRAGLALHRITGMDRLELTGTVGPLPQLRILRGVLMVPSPVSSEEWSRAAQRHQAELAAGGTP